MQHGPVPRSALVGFIRELTQGRLHAGSGIGGRGALPPRKRRLSWRGIGATLLGIAGVLSFVADARPVIHRTAAAACIFGRRG